ncbi:MAG TPA: TraR/DksA C4-type zinc finger protein [Candidatus Kapabacteria bacterium]|nr:TraR/DksA C4-type zinc finger protein [Candidatus Kapabacteria bacterium]
MATKKKAAPKKSAKAKPAKNAPAKSVKAKAKPAAKQNGKAKVAGNKKMAVKTKMRAVAAYSQKDLNDFRQNIDDQIREAREELENVSEHLMDSMTGEYEDENSVYSLHMADQGTDAMEREKAFLQAQRQNDYLKKLNEALERIEDGSYGACVVCGKLIEKPRLLAVPVTQKHVDCKNKEAASAPRPVQREEEPLHHFPEMN